MSEEAAAEVRNLGGGVGTVPGKPRAGGRVGSWRFIRIFRKMRGFQFCRW